MTVFAGRKLDSTAFRETEKAFTASDEDPA
jgi:hypothetical protein